MAANEDQNSATERKKVSVKNSYGETLVGILHETGSRELVIICHGLRSSKDRIPMINLAAAFEKEGISAFRFDFTGNGESEGPFLCGDTNREVDDIHSVVQHFRKEGRNVVAVIGHSKGGNSVTYYASRYHDVQIIVNISGCFDLVRGLEGHLGKGFLDRVMQNGFIDVKSKRGTTRITKETMAEGLKLDTRDACQKIDENCRVLLIHGLKDDFVAIDHTIEFCKYIKHSRLHFVQGADHEYTLHQNELSSLVLDFVREKLRAYKNAYQCIPSRL